jgi:hypothetical protein
MTSAIDATAWLRDMKAAESDKLARLETEAVHDEAAREVLADVYEGAGRSKDAALLRGEIFPLPPKRPRKRIEKLTSTEENKMRGWAQRWIEIGLRHGPTTAIDVAQFRAGICAAYEAAKLAPPKRIVWTTSPLAAVLAGPIAMHVLGSGALNVAVPGAIRQAVGIAVRGAVDVAVDVAVDDAVSDAVDDAVSGAVSGAVSDAVDDAVSGAPSVIRDNWYRYLGGQPWVGWGYGYRGPAYVSFLQDVCRLQLAPAIERAARAYQAICRSCWWLWPHSDFVIVAPRPMRIERDADGRLTLAEWPDGSRVERGKDGTYRLNVDVRKVLAMLGGEREGKEGS